MTIRDFTKDDWEAYLSMARTFYSGDATLFTLPEAHFRRTYELGIVGSPHMRMLMLTDETGEVQGYAHLAFSWTCEAGGLVCWLEEIYIQEAYRGQGYAKAFMDWLFEEYGDSCARFRLEVCPENMGVKLLYEKMGFSQLPYIQMVKRGKA